MLRALAGLVGNGFAALTSWFRLKERRASEDAGQDRERLKQREDLDDAEERADTVKRPTSAGLIKRLRRGGL